MNGASRLCYDLQCAKSCDERRIAITSALESQSFAAIRRIPEILAPLSSEEKETIRNNKPTNIYQNH